MWGFNISGSYPGMYMTGGMEELVFDWDDRATYDYIGEGSSIGGGASTTVYIGYVSNITDASEYAGPFASIGLTFSYGSIGGTVSYFWDSSSSIFSPDAVHGFYIGYSPGAQASIWWSTTTYEMTYQTP
jgi:hypothetical protein